VRIFFVCIFGDNRIRINFGTSVYIIRQSNNTDFIKFLKKFFLCCLKLEKLIKGAETINSKDEVWQDREIALSKKAISD